MTHQLVYSSHMPSTRFPTGTVLVLLTPFQVCTVPPVVVTLLLIVWVRLSSDAGTFKWAGPITGYHLALLFCRVLVRHPNFVYIIAKYQLVCMLYYCFVYKTCILLFENYWLKKFYYLLEYLDIQNTFDNLIQILYLD